MATREQTLNTAVQRAWAAPPTRYGTAMLRRFGWFYYAMGMGRAFGKVRLEDHAVDRIRTASQHGPVVYVMPRGSTVDHLVLNTVLNRRRLPLSVWANGATSFFWQPVAAAWRDLLHRWRCFFREGPAPDPVTSGWVTGRVAQGDSITVFLDDQRSWLDRIRGQKAPDVLDALIKAQADLEAPIQLVPAVVVWDRGPDRAGSAVRDFLEGARQASGFFAEMTRAWVRSGEATVVVGDAVALPELNQRVSPERRSRALHALLRRYLHRESKVVRGPRLLRHHVMRGMVLDNPPMRQLAIEEAEAQGTSVQKIRRKMSREFDQVAARFSWATIRALSVVLRPLWTKVFSGVDVRPEDLERIRQAVRGGSAVLVPCHKSHMDYLLLSWVFFSNDLICPHVVAGNNLAIWPLSIVLRGAGGFFIKRSFSGQRIHPAVFSRYLRELLHHGYTVEFFIEGGRTRSGKLMKPRVGVLGMVLDGAELRPTGRDVTLLPIALAYEQVAEEGAYARELGGEEKEAETMEAFVRSTAVIRRRYGKVYLRVGEPIPVSELVDETPDQPAWSSRTPEDRHQFLTGVGERIVHRIGEATVVLPTAVVAAALLTHHRQGIHHEELAARALRFRVFLQRRGALEADSMKQWAHASNGALDRFVRARRIEPMELDGKRIWSVLPSQRITLAFYMNQVLHFFAPAAIATAAIRGLKDRDQIRAEELLPTFELLLQMLDREFIFDPDQQPAQLLADALAHLVDHGALSTAVEGAHSIADTDRIAEIHGLIRPLLESYRLVLSQGEQLHSRPELKDWVKSLQRDQERWIATGRITRPEALSLVNLQNAVKSQVDDGIFQMTTGRLSLVTAARDARLAQLEPLIP